MLFNRGPAGGFCLWPHSSLSLERAYQNAVRELGPLRSVGFHLGHHLKPESIVARRHYVETGTLRAFEVRYTPTDAAEQELARKHDADGMILVLLPETPSERKQAVRWARSRKVKQRPEILVAVPAVVEGLAASVQNVRCWSWVAENTPELLHDDYAANEAARQLEGAKSTLNIQVDHLIGVTKFGVFRGIDWFQAGRSVKIPTGGSLRLAVSDLCNRLFDRAPCINSELVNRRQVSSAAARASNVLIQRILEADDRPLLDLGPRTAPPEKSVYLSFLAAGRLHRDIDGMHEIRLPEPGDDPCRLLPTFERMQEILCEQPGKRLTATAIFDALTAPPFGIRAGVLPLLLALFARTQAHHLAFYESGSFVPVVDGETFMRLNKAPATFELQWNVVEGVRAALFGRLLRLLGKEQPGDRPPQILDVVTPLCMFAARLPEYTRGTDRLSRASRAVRTVLLRASDPVSLIFEELPVAVGQATFDASDSDEAQQRASEFVHALRDALIELKSALPGLRERMAANLSQCFDLEGSLQAVRQRLMPRVRHLLTAVHAPRLRALCFRLADSDLPPDAWLDSIGSLVCSKPPDRWSDGDEDRFAEELARLAVSLKRAETAAFSCGPGQPDGGGVSIVLTRGDGTEVGGVCYVAPEEEDQAAELVRQIAALLPASRRLALAAAARVFWATLDEGSE